MDPVHSSKITFKAGEKPKITIFETAKEKKNLSFNFQYWELRA
jgi:hypothetical protein